MQTVKFDELFEVMRYPAGEPHVQMKSGNRYIPDISDLETVICEAYDFNDLAVIRTASVILSRMGHYPEWVIPYFPFARHDRRNDRYDGLELETAINMVSELDVTIIDPHSDVAGLLPHYHQAAFVYAAMSNGLGSGGVYAIPDAGATKKTYEWAPPESEIPTVQCYKRRDPKTGKLSGFKVDGDVDGKDVVIVDDICDGGGTFLGLATELYSKGAMNLSLAVTHGLFTKGLPALASNFHKIFTLENSWNKIYKDQAGVTLIPVTEITKRKSWKR